MKIHLHPPLCFHEAGQRENNEDSIYPPIGIPAGKGAHPLFLVCDGVGGRAQGEEASQIVCEVLSARLKHLPVVRQEHIDQAILLAEGAIDTYTKEHVEAKGMATTLTLLSIHQEGATIAHLGDSRVYQFRNQSIVFKTKDHSFVNELVEKNIISEAESRHHPQRNVVTKAIMGGATSF